jgi:hypothetical protein
MRTVLLASLATSLALTACIKKDSTDTDSADSIVDDSDSTEAEGNVMMATVDGADMSGLAALDAGSVSARIAANVGVRWLPAGCATAVDNGGGNIAITMNDCTGPRGLVHVTGEIDLAVSVSVSGGISVHATASGLEVNAATLDLDATADYAVVGGQHTLTVQSTASGSGPRGTEIDHQGDYTVSWDPTNQCRSITGTWSTDFTGPNRSAQRSNAVDLTRCGDACPTGSLTHHGLLGLTINITFDGSNVAQWSTSTGRTGTVNLRCQ